MASYEKLKIEYSICCTKNSGKATQDLNSDDTTRELSMEK